MNMVATRTRMSPLTAMFLGMFFVGGLVIASATAVVLYSMRIIDHKSASLLNFAGNTVEGLPELLKSLPPALADVLNDRRAPEYVGNLDVQVRFLSDSDRGVQPVLTVKNNGNEVVSMLALRVAAIDNYGLPHNDCTQVVATPLALQGSDWPGPIMPGATRQVVLPGSRHLAKKGESFVAVVEIGDVRVWQPETKIEQ